jgi:hypothetical protein
VGVEVSKQKHGLEEDDARAPDCRASPRTGSRIFPASGCTMKRSVAEKKMARANSRVMSAGKASARQIVTRFATDSMAYEKSLDKSGSFRPNGAVSSPA